MALLGAVLVFLSAADLVVFNRIVNATRSMYSVFDWSLPQWSPGGRLAYMTLNDRSHLFDLRDGLRYIESRPDNFLLWGDSRFSVAFEPSVGLPGALDASRPHDSAAWHGGVRSLRSPDC
jgi:hypothetical protein